MTPPASHPHDLASIFRHFDSRSDFIAAQPYGTGHINDTYRISASQGGHRIFFTLQHLNTRVFTDGPGLMENVLRITVHAGARLRAEGATDASRRALQVIPALDGKPYHVDAAGMFWRLYIFIDGVQTFDKITQPRHAYEAARAFGLFQRLLADLPGRRLHETIPGFHHTRRRFEALGEALRRDVCGRAAGVAREIEFARAREKICGTLVDAMASGAIPERVTHNDTKVNNVLMDEKTDEGMCVIDLDTCMPGCALYDFGDMVRSATNTTAEDDPDLSHVTCNRGVFETLVRGYLGAADFLTPAERDHLVMSGRLMTLECGMRFLTDHLQGDTYFKIHRKNHNLDRCRTQFALVKSIEDQADDLQRIVDSAT